MKKYFLGVDNGGTMTKAAVFDEAGREIASSAYGSPLLTLAPGFTERNMEVLWIDTATVIKNAVENAGISADEIVSVACTGHGKGLYLWGKDDRPVRNGIVSTDTRAGGYIARWKQNGIAAAAYEKTLQKLQVSQPCALLAWLKDNEPDAYKNIKWIFAVKDYIRFRLTGIARAEITDCSGTSLMNLRTRSYDSALPELFGIPEISEALPPLVTATEVCGAVTQEASALTGLHCGTPVAGGMFDIDACAIASGITDERQLCVIAGTWSINEYVSKKPVEASGVTSNSIFCLPEYYLVEESSPTSAGNLEWFVKSILDSEQQELKQQGKSIYACLDEMVEKLSPQDSDVIFLPYLFGAPDMPTASASFFGLTGRHTKADVVRAIFEGVVFCHREHITRLLDTRDKPECIRLSGGAANSPVWSQLFADIIGLPVEIVPVKEIGALGCAIAGAVAVGVYEDCGKAAEKMVPLGNRMLPNTELRDLYDRKYERYQGLINRLKPLWHVS